MSGIKSAITAAAIFISRISFAGFGGMANPDPYHETEYGTSGGDNVSTIALCFIGSFIGFLIADHKNKKGKDLASTKIYSITGFILTFVILYLLTH